MENHHHDSWNDRKEWEIKRLTEKLNLTNEQVIKVQEIFKNSVQEEAKRNETNENEEKYGNLMREEHHKKMEAIKKILTPEQLKLFNENKEDGMWHSRN
jgi:Spy/CpxP family protein refolding chaperone